MRCPVCKADNSQGPQCRRCKADLSLLVTLEDQRRRTLSEARRFLHRGEWRAAIEHASAANGLRADEETQRLMAAAYLLDADFATAWQCYQTWRTLSRSE